jgi:hypothetical protein
MWGALLAASSTGWLHHLTATHRHGRLVGHGVRGSQAMIATLRRRLLAVPARLVVTLAGSPCGCHPAISYSPRSSPDCAPSHTRPDQARTAPTSTGTRTRGDTRAGDMPNTPSTTQATSTPRYQDQPSGYSRIRVRCSLTAS